MVQQTSHPQILEHQPSSKSTFHNRQSWSPLGRLFLIGMATGVLFLTHNHLTHQDPQSNLQETQAADSAKWLSEVPRRITTPFSREQNLFISGLFLTGGCWWTLEYLLKMRQRLAQAEEAVALRQEKLKDNQIQIHASRQQIVQEVQRRNQLQEELSKAHVSLSDRSSKLQDLQQVVQQQEKAIHKQKVDQQDSQTHRRELEKKLVIEQQLRSDMSHSITEQRTELHTRHHKIQSLQQQRCYLVAQVKTAQHELTILKEQLDHEIANRESNIEQKSNLELENLKNLETIDYLHQEIQQKENEISHLQWEKHKILEENWSLKKTPHTSTQAEIPQFKSMLQVLEYAEQVWGDVLQVWDSARQSAAAIDHQRWGKFKKIHQCLSAIAEIGQVDLYHRAHGSSLGKSWEIAMTDYPEIGSKYRHHESSATMNQYGHQRCFSHQGERKTMHQHITISGPEGALQIYFSVTQQHVQIGYCGRHLEYDSQTS